MGFPEIPDDYLDDIIKVFLLGIETEFIDDNGVKIPDIIARPYPKDDPRYFPYVVEWKSLFKLRASMIRYLENSDDDKLVILAKIIKMIHATDKR